MERKLEYSCRGGKISFLHPFFYVIDRDPYYKGQIKKRKAHKFKFHVTQESS